MTDLIKGANAPLVGSDVSVVVSWRDRNPEAEELDVSAFLLGPDKKVSGDADMIFYGQREAADGSVRIRELAVADEDGRRTALGVDLSRVRPDVHAIAVVATMGAAAGKRRISDLERLSVSAAASGAEPLTYRVDTADAGEAALILGELYLRNGAWKVRAVGQGFEGGLGPLARQYGVEIADEPAAAPPPPSPAPPPPPSQSVNLSKVTLTKERPSVDLRKKAAGFGQIEVNLNWNPGERKKALFGFGSSGAIDLDLGCLYELADGSAGAVQALGNAFGDYESPPYVQLAGDDRSGTSTEGEWMRINGARWDSLKRVLIFAFIYEGVPNWAAADATVTLYMPDDPPVEVRLDETAAMGMCAIAEVANVGGGIRMTRLVRYFRDHKVMSDDFGYPLRWQAGRK